MKTYFDWELRQKLDNVKALQALALNNPPNETLLERVELKNAPGTHSQEPWTVMPVTS